MSLLYRLGVLFFTFLKISLFVIGGGLAMLPIVEQTFTRKHKLLTKEEILDMVIITQTVPGLVAVNSAIYVGTKVAGFLGATVAVIGVMMPSLVLIMMIAKFFPDLNSNNALIQSAFLAIRACVTGVLIATAIRLAHRVVHKKRDVFMVMGCCILLILKVNPLWVILGAMLIGFLFLYRNKKRASFKLAQEAQND